MLGGVRLKVVSTHEKTCFAYINPRYNVKNDQSQCVQVICKDKSIYLWVVFSGNVHEGFIACNPVHSRLLGLDEGADVFVTPYTDMKVLDDLYVDTDSPDDQEILEHNAEFLQMNLLDQLRLVVANQKAVVWISASMPIIFTPKQTGILNNHSRVIVKIHAFNSFESSHSTSDVPKETNSKFKSISTMNEQMLAPYLNIPKRLILRAIPIDSDGKKNLIHPYTVFMHEDLVADKYKQSIVVLATMNTIPPLTPESVEEDEDTSSNIIEDLCVEIVPVNNVIFRSLCREIYNRNIPTVLIPKSLNSIINIENGTRVIITFIGDKVEQPEHIDVVVYSDQIQPEVDVIEKFKNCVITNTHSGKKFLINNNMLKQNSEITPGFLQFKLKPERLKYTMLNSESFRDCSVAAKCLPDSDLVLSKHAVGNVDYDYKNYCRTVKSVESLVEKVISHVYFELHREASFRGASEVKSNILITGLSGSGKSSICHMLQKDLTVWSHILHCRSLRGRKDIPEVVGKAVLLCQEHSPAVLICDDVDALVPAQMEGLSPQDIAYYQRLAVVIKQSVQSCAGVCAVMTCLTVRALHPILRQFNGKPLFTAQFGIPELDQEERIELFNHFLNEKIRDNFHIADDDVIRMAMDTGGHSVREITDYLNKKIYKAVKKKKSQSDLEKPRLIEEVTKDVEKARGFDVWGPLGGLDEAKRVLTEAIFWPMMYPVLFPSQSCGVLLYGPPGTGKSHIGSCLARAHNVNIITVKGPELLSKYIGQSEAAVRDVFDKADMQRPCILFFDEFDSLAPRRGHDSTGVTDRVVNQLLTRLDGAEGGARGPVVCATSRPDLIDPALLRAGRLQTHVFTHLPDKRGRCEVLVTLKKNVIVEEAVDVERIAELTEGYSPADLKSLLVTAQLARLEKQIMESSDEKAMSSVVVRQEDIDEALLETKPSLSREQRDFYDMIYKKFRGEPLSSEQRLMSNQLTRQRVTLA